jgi:hypothetical protein
MWVKPTKEIECMGLENPLCIKEGILAHAFCILVSFRVRL